MAENTNKNQVSSQNASQNKNEFETEQAQNQWVREQFQKANKHLAENGIIPDRVIMEQSRYLVPFVAVWKVVANTPKKKQYWVISGDLPSDFVDLSVAKTARDALKHFSLSWQLKAENLIQSGATKDSTQAKFANLLIDRAQNLYDLQANDKLWQHA